MAAQDIEAGDILEQSVPKIKFNKKNKTNTEYLVSKLLQDKSTEKEKFDAIFYWVSSNINYNINSFYTASQAGPKQIEKIMKSRSTICLGYAQLMDSLCKLAGIENYTIFGYAKDEFYDIKDSIYGHNHAWNAVKLEGKWYLYDVTWSTGVQEIKYTRKSKLVLKLLKKFPTKYKSKTIKLGRKFKRFNFCNEKHEPIKYQTQKFWNRKIRNLIARIPIKVYYKYKKGINTKYYLTEPNLFAADHIPDDPTWSLTDRKTVSEFERDSLFYYLNDSLYIKQQRQGVECGKCDEIYKADYQQQLVYLNHNSKKFNRNNKFINTFCEEELGKIYFYKQLQTTNNSTKQIDTSLTFFNNALKNLTHATVLMEVFFKTQKNKNDRKKNILLAENKKHVIFFKSRVKNSLTHKLKFQQMINKSSTFGKNNYDKYYKLKHFKTDIDTKKIKTLKESRLNELLSKKDKLNKLLDSLNNSASSQRNIFDSCLINLSLNIFNVVKTHDTIISPFIQSTQQRLFLKDNYKKSVIDIRKNLPEKEAIYLNRIDNIVYLPAQCSETTFISLHKTLIKKERIYKDLLKIEKELAKSGNSNEENLMALKQRALNDLKQDICWIRPTYARLSVTRNGLEALKNKQQFAIRVVEYENHIERLRHSYIIKALKLGHKNTKQQLGYDTAELKGKIKDVSKFRLLLIKQKFDSNLMDHIIKRFKKDNDKIIY